MEPPAPPDRSGQRSFWRRVFSAEHLAGDVRSALIGSGTGGAIGLAAAAATALFFAKASVDFTVFVNQDGIGQPSALFNLAEKEDPKLKLQFTPAELRDVYICEYKHVTSDSWKNAVLQYLDSYRDCFDVSDRGDKEFLIAANRRSSRLEQKKGSFLCECQIRQ